MCYDVSASLIASVLSGSSAWAASPGLAALPLARAAGLPFLREREKHRQTTSRHRRDRPITQPTAIPAAAPGERTSEEEEETTTHGLDDVQETQDELDVWPVAELYVLLGQETGASVPVGQNASVGQESQAELEY